MSSRTYQQALAAHQAGRGDEAKALYEKAIAQDPRQPDALHLLGVINYQRNSFKEAERLIREAIRFRPSAPAYHNNLGLALFAQHRFDDAVNAYDAALALDAEFVDAVANKAAALREAERHEEAVEAYRAALEAKPERLSLVNGLAMALMALKKWPEAIETLKQSLELQPRQAMIWGNLGAAQNSIGLLDDARISYHKALELDPNFRGIDSSFLFTRNYFADSTVEEMLHFAADFGRKRAQRAPRKRSPDPERRLRVGLLSGDFRLHSVSFFLVHVVEALDLNVVELFAYSTKEGEDHVTKRLQAAIPHWRQIENRTDSQVEALILRDGIDILIDMAGHTAGNRLDLLDLKPAPIQATWLGYSGTTGLATVDYMIGDRYVTPEDVHQSTEKPWLLPDSYLCFEPPPSGEPRVGPLPALANGYVTFGCFNNLNKLSPATLELWARIAARVPGSRFMIKSSGQQKDTHAKRVAATLLEGGLSDDRLVFPDYVPDQTAARDLYNQVDIALDPFPYNGTTTSCDALWMGCPMLTLAGDRFIARVGVSLMSTLGMPEWVAASHDEYVEKGVAFAADIPRLSEIRAGLRQRFETSPLCDAPRFARNFEAALRGMWRKWCARQLAEL